MWSILKHVFRKRDSEALAAFIPWTVLKKTLITASVQGGRNRDAWLD